ncbi:Phosphorylated carbohydrates phosphatase [Burkholderiales bacterium]|nr:Phosphorylated carbohydrates phosphatase [Burkholderiales bacterium]
MSPRPSRRPAAIILDMDGTLLDTEPLAARAWGDAAAALGVAFDPGLPGRLIGRSFADCRALIVERHGGRYPTDALMSRWHAAYDAIVEREGLELKPGVVELFAWLDAEGIARAVATSTRRERAYAKLQRAALASRLHALVGGDEVGRGKPAPDIFLEAAARLGVDPTSCIVLEDSDAGVRGALAAGMVPIMIPDLLPPSPDIVAANLLVVDTLHHALACLAALPHPATGTPGRETARRTIVR